LSRATTWCAVMFMLCAMALVLRTDRAVVQGGSVLQKVSQPAPAKTTPPPQKAPAPATPAPQPAPGTSTPATQPPPATPAPAPKTNF
jgi:hypothetical protein